MTFTPADNAASLKIPLNIYLRILGKALDQTRDDLDEFTAALETQNTETIQRLSHRWKGDFGNLRITELATIAKDMNDRSKNACDTAEIAGLFQSFKTGFQELDACQPNERAS